MTKRAAVVGDNCIDCYGGSTPRGYPGGNAVNTAVYLGRSGIATTYVGTIGTDNAGGYLRRCLEEERICLDYLATKEGRTGRTFVDVRDGERHFVCDDPGVQVPFVLSEDQICAIAHFDLAHFSAFTSWAGGAAQNEPYLVQELGRARLTSTQARLSVDFSMSPEGEALFNEIGAYLDYSFFSRSELSDEQVAEFVREMSPCTQGTIVVTRGCQGSAAGGRREDTIFHPPARCSVLDTLGAGDAFIAGFLAAAINGPGSRDALKAGTETAAVALQTHGAWSNRVVERQSADRRMLLP